MIGRGVWFAAGAAAGVYATVKARRVAEAFTPDGIRDRLNAVGLGARRDTLAGDLSFYERRRLEMARTIAQRPRLVLADEPTAGLSPAESGHVIELLGRAFDTTTTILLIEHRIDAVEAVCPRALLLAEGRLVADAPTRDMRQDRRLASVYFGSRLTP